MASALQAQGGIVVSPRWAVLQLVDRGPVDHADILVLIAQRAMARVQGDVGCPVALRAAPPVVHVIRVRLVATTCLRTVAGSPARARSLRPEL